MRGDVEAVKSLITAGADMNIRDRVRPQVWSFWYYYIHFLAQLKYCTARNFRAVQSFMFFADWQILC